MKKIALIVFVVHSSFLLSEPISPMNQPIWGLSEVGITEYPMSPKQLFESECLLNQTNENGDLVHTTITKKSAKDRNLSYHLITSVNNKQRMIGYFGFIEENNKLIMNYIKVVFIEESKKIEVQYDGTEYSLGRILGIFKNASQLFIDFDLIKAKFSPSDGEEVEADDPVSQNNSTVESDDGE